AKTINRTLDRITEDNGEEFSGHESTLSELVFVLENMLNNMIFDLTNHEFGFPFAKPDPENPDDDPSNPIPQAAYLSLKDQVRMKKKNGEPLEKDDGEEKPRTVTPIRCYMLDVLGLLWLEVHKKLLLIPQSRLRKIYDTARYKTFVD